MRATPSWARWCGCTRSSGTGRYDVVHTHLYRAQVYARPAARLARDAGRADHRALHRRDAHRAAQDDRSVRALYLASELFSDATIAVADIVRDRLVRWGVPGRKITVIPNGLDFAGLGFDPATRTRSASSSASPRTPT